MAGCASFFFFCLFEYARSILMTQTGACLFDLRSSKEGAVSVGVGNSSGHPLDRTLNSGGFFLIMYASLILPLSIFKNRNSWEAVWSMHRVLPALAPALLLLLLPCPALPCLTLPCLALPYLAFPLAFFSFSMAPSLSDHD